MALNQLLIWSHWFHGSKDVVSPQYLNSIQLHVAATLLPLAKAYLADISLVLSADSVQFTDLTEN